VSYRIGNSFSVLPKCPYCGKENVPKRSPNQATCGEFACSNKHAQWVNLENKRKRREKKGKQNELD